MSQTIEGAASGSQRPPSMRHVLAGHPRLTPARPDLAAASLQGSVEAERFVEATRRQVTASVLDLRREPRADGALDSQLLHGETVQVFDENEGWAWVQAERDDYVGYVASHGLHPVGGDATHQVAVARTFVYPAADMKRAVVTALPLGSLVTVVETSEPFARLVDGGYVWRAHLRMLSEESCGDPVATAERLVGVPYLWGGRTPEGLDCSGLVQLSFGMAGITMPRDASMQEEFGQALSANVATTDLRRGDLVFWTGHVGIMIDAATLLHASGHQMLVCAEPLQVAIRRIEEGEPWKKISSARRVM